VNKDIDRQLFRFIFAVNKDIDRQLVSVVFGFVRAFRWDSKVLALIAREFGEHGGDTSQVSVSNLLVKLLGHNVNFSSLVLSRFSFLPEFKLGEGLVGKRGGHDERRMSSSASEVDESARSEQDDVTAIGKSVSVDLWLDGVLFGAVSFEPGGVDFTVKVADVANNRVFFELEEMLASDDVFAAGRGHDQVGEMCAVVHSVDLEAFHSGLKRVDRIDFCHDNSAAKGLQGESRTFANITVASDDGAFTSQHNVGSSFDTVDEGLSATVEVVEFALCHGVVDVDRSEAEFGVLDAFVKVVHTSGGLF